MTKTIHKQMVVPQAREDVWRALTHSAALAEWMYPNDFEPRVGHQFTFRVPPNPKVGFEGLVVRCEVLICEAPSRLEFSWAAGGLADSRVSFRLEPDGAGTRLVFEHSGFDVSQPWGEQAFQGATYGWAKMLGQLPDVIPTCQAAVSNERTFSASPQRVFAAFAQPEQLAQWWGPKDFTNTFEQFDFTPGGRWLFVMHGPNGADYRNENFFREIQPDARIVLEHILPPWFKLTVTLTARGEQTHLAWVQQFENAEAAAKLRSFCEPANEEVLDRLQALLAS